MRTVPVEASKPRQQGGGKQARLPALWPRVREQLVQALRDPDALIEEHRRRILAEHEVEARTLAEEAEMLDEIDTALEGLRHREDRLYEDYARDDIDRDLYRRQKSVIENERQGHQQRKHEILAQRLTVTHADHAARDLRQALHRVREMDPGRFPDELWSKILPELVETIVLDVNAEATINWRRL